ncbi:hypothetical protein BC332_20671 [Capsicum chinense]|nr:hypothetical protein BC332_20671 [Capsicum chinense]
MELFGATTITRKIILEGGANDAPLTVFETTSHYDYDLNGCTKFSPNFAASIECSVCKCQDCKAKYYRVINAINELTASVKKMTSKGVVIPSRRISYPDTPLEIKAAKRRRIDTSKASSSRKKSKMAMPLSLSYTDVQCARSTGEQHKLKKEVSQNEECLINIIKGFSILAGLPWHLVEEVYIPINCSDEFHWVLAVIVLKKRHIRVYNSIRDCGPFVATYTEYLRDGLQVPNDGLDAGLLRKRYVALLWKYGEAKSQKPYATDIKDPRLPKPNSVAPDEEQLFHID